MKLAKADSILRAFEYVRSQLNWKPEQVAVSPALYTQLEAEVGSQLIEFWGMPVSIEDGLNANEIEFGRTEMMVPLRLRVRLPNV